MEVKSEILDFDDLVNRLKEIKKLGYVKTHRRGNTGIGKTLEDLLGIEENNIPSPNAVKCELKSARKNAKSMLTLFTKSPLPRKSNTRLLKNFGYPSKKGNNKLELHSTVSARCYNTLKGKQGFKINVEKDRIELVTGESKQLGMNLFVGGKAIKPQETEVQAYWTKEILKTSFERKLPKLLYVKAEQRGSGEDEMFLFNEAWLLGGFSFDNFLKLLNQSMILIDIRIGQYPDGRTHDHGTGFRVMPDKLDMCFSHRERII